MRLSCVGFASVSGFGLGFGGVASCSFGGGLLPEVPKIEEGRIKIMEEAWEEERGAA